MNFNQFRSKFKGSKFSISSVTKLWKLYPEKLSDIELNKRISENFNFKSFIPKKIPIFKKSLTSDIITEGEAVIRAIKIKINKINLNELPKFEKYYNIDRLLFEGNENIFLVKDKLNNLYVAKEMTDIYTLYEAELMRLAFEITKTHKIHNNPFLKFYGMYITNKKMPVYVMEYFKGFTLEYHKYTEKQIKNIVRNIYTGLNMLHSNNMVHGDPHSGNILYDGKRLVMFDITLQDETTIYIDNYARYFTTEKILNSISTDGIYITDEIVIDFLNQKVDISEFGYSILNIFTNSDMAEEIYLNNPGVYQNFTPYPWLNELLRRILHVNIFERPTSQEVLNFINNLKQNKLLFKLLKTK